MQINEKDEKIKEKSGELCTVALDLKARREYNYL